MEPITSTEARHQLDRAADQLSTATDRRVHAAATALFGIVLGAYLAASTLVPDGISTHLATGAYAAALIGLALWQTRSARTIPRGARRHGRIGLACTAALSMVAIPVLNIRANTTGLPWWLALGMALLVAFPLVLAGWTIWRARP